jgi:hypothetical protein
MSELALQEKAAEEATTINSTKFIKDDFPSVLPYISAWRVPSRVQQVTEFEVRITSAVDKEEQKTLVSDWPRNEDPFTQVDLIDIEDKQVQELILQIRMSTFIPNNECLANRLIVLFNDAKEEDSNSPGIAVGSLRNFYFFLLLPLRTDLKYPAISLTPDNDIYVSWRNVQNQVFSVHFLPNEDIRFVIFKQNDKHPERTIRLSGTTTTDTLWISG